MTRIRKSCSKEMLNQQLDEVSMSENEDDVPLSRLRDSLLSAKDKEKKQIKQKREESEEMQVKKKPKLEWTPEDCAKSIGKMIKLTGEGKNMKYHYETFEFHGKQYELEDTVHLVPENVNEKTYIAIIKDIYVKEKDGLVKLEVQWLYRKDDVEKTHFGKLESEDSKEIFLSFHRDEVFAESVKHKCLVYFVRDDKQIPNRIEHHPDFIVQQVYDNINKRLMKFSCKGFNVQQKFEINVLVAKTISRIGDHLHDIKKVEMTKIPRRKRSVRQRCSKPVLEKLECLPSPDFDRDEKLEELLDVLLKHVCCARMGKQAGDYDSDNIIQVVFALEDALNDSFPDDIPMFNYKLELLIEKLENSQVLAKRLVNGEIKPEKVIKMKGYELMMADFEEPKLVEDAESTSKSVGAKDSLED